MRDTRADNTQARRSFPCQRCGYRILVGSAKCKSCGHWNTINALPTGGDGSILLADIGEVQDLKRIVSGPWDACFGGGIDLTSVTLIGGEAGAGKSTIATQIIDAVCGVTQREGLYVAVEENLKQINYRTSRLAVHNRKLIRMLPMTSVGANLGQIILVRKPCIVVIDSLSHLVGNDGEAGVESCKRFKEYATELECPFLVIDHVTKDGDFAGFEALKHAVDCTMMYTVYDDDVRMLQTIKNRSGRGMVKRYFDMTENGLVALEECGTCGAVKCNDHPLV